MMAEVTFKQSVSVCLEKKKPKYFLVISFTKLRRFWWNLVMVSWINLLETVKRFPPHLNNVSIILHYLVKLTMFIAHVLVLPLSCWGNSRIYLIVTVASKFTRFEFSWMIACEKYCKRRCRPTKHALLIWTKRNSNWERNEPIWITSLLQPVVSGVVSRSRSSDACFVHLLLQYSTITVIKLSNGFKSGECGGYS